MTACEIIDSDTFVGGENNFNIFTCSKDVNAENDEDRMRLLVSSRIAVGRTCCY